MFGSIWTQQNTTLYPFNEIVNIKGFTVSIVSIYKGLNFMDRWNRLKMHYICLLIAAYDINNNQNDNKESFKSCLG